MIAGIDNTALKRACSWKVACRPDTSIWKKLPASKVGRTRVQPFAELRCVWWREQPVRFIELPPADIRGGRSALPFAKRRPWLLRQKESKQNRPDSVYLAESGVLPLSAWAIQTGDFLTVFTRKGHWTWPTFWDINASAHALKLEFQPNKNKHLNVPLEYLR